MFNNLILTDQITAANKGVLIFNMIPYYAFLNQFISLTLGGGCWWNFNSNLNPIVNVVN